VPAGLREVAVIGRLVRPVQRGESCAQAGQNDREQRDVPPDERGGCASGAQTSMARRASADSTPQPISCSVSAEGDAS
jgi:hypothetical protein